MNRLAEVQARYMQDGLAVRLGGLAADLARVASFSLSPANPSVVDSLLYESKHFIEWTAPEAEPGDQVRLVELQRLIIAWEDSWRSRHYDDAWRPVLAAQAREWSQRVLEMSGLLGEVTAAE